MSGLRHRDFISAITFSHMVSHTGLTSCANIIGDIKLLECVDQMGFENVSFAAGRCRLFSGARRQSSLHFNATWRMIQNVEWMDELF